ncbi:hypothetical protein E2C01_000996 [Portunus trituberculatus]|uniref:Uncharacterized protein n=1 Tax=Portunus trituberculatus TaxID=210409 RepID=A0A5B7CI82_PORTR|nr:hypothetical protein [Portunus trituberculatus]
MTAAAPTPRGKVETKEEAGALLKITAFKDLPQEGREAFFRFLCGDNYPENKDICDINPNADEMNEFSRKYQFWLQCEQVEHYSRLFQNCICSDDDRFSEVNECFDPNRDGNLKDFLDKKQADTESTKKFASTLKEKIEPKLNKQYEEFQKYLQKFGDKDMFSYLFFLLFGDFAQLQKLMLGD